MPFLVLDIQLVVQGILYLASFVIGFAVSIPLGVTTINFGGQCILYGDVKWQNETFFRYTPTDMHNCNFAIYLNVFGCIFYSLGMVIYHGYAMTRKDPNIGSQMWVMPFILVNALMTVIIFISSCMISVGFKVFCDGLLSGNEKGARVKSCADGQQWDWNRYGTDYTTDTYYTYLAVTQTATWTSFLVWSVQVILGIFRFIRNRPLRSKDQFHDPAPSVDSPGNSKTPADLENFASIQSTA
ncbi:transmembrane protein 179B-like [Haliotis rubra]|uniref:transmembrane protein 179B-like n=1 Tax=Haliotis rubra TaxID=36100 RepID=UPI001EE56F34|nr:transmembrane protein 179B-like [Haliotis rubra]